MDKNIIPKQLFNNRQTKHIKGALIINLKNLKELEYLNQRKRWQITILAKDYSKKWSKNRQFKTTNKNKL